MSTRYGIGLALEPGFTARAYRARQLICGQYASWAAEMHMVYLPVSGYFECAEPVVALVDAGLAEIAAQSKETAAQFLLSHRGVDSHFDTGCHIFLAFTGSNDSLVLSDLHTSVAGLLEKTLDPEPGARFLPRSALGHSEGNSGENYRSFVPLMQYAKLPATIFEDAVEFARAVVDDLQIPAATRAWRLLLLRFISEAAGEDWEGGRWAVDLRWELLASYPL